jgi:hypothetical protein
VMQEARNVGGRTGLGRAAEILSAGKGHHALVAAQHLIEDAARLNAISIVGDQEYWGIWRPEILTAQDSQDMIFDWPIAGGSVTAEPVSPRIGLSRYRDLRMADADIEKLAAMFDEWLATSKNERADLARRWWMHPSHKPPQKPAEEDRFPLPLWAVDFGLVTEIAQHREILPHTALTVLGDALRAMIRTRDMAEEDRTFLAEIAKEPRTDATLIRLRRLVEEIMSAELTGSPESRLRVLQLFDPDVSNNGEAPAALEEKARAAIFARDDLTKQTPEIGGPSEHDSDFADGIGKPGPRTPKGRDDVIRQRLLRGDDPGQNVSWKEFCDAVRDAAGGWVVDKRDGRPRRGFNDKAIGREVDRIRDNRAGHRG